MQIYITDKTGKKGWNTNVTERYASGERANINRHFQNILNGHPAYAKCGYDVESLMLVEEKDSFGDGPDKPFKITAQDARMSIDDILKELEL